MDDTRKTTPSGVQSEKHQRHKKAKWPSAHFSVPPIPHHVRSGAVLHSHQCAPQESSGKTDKEVLKGLLPKQASEFRVFLGGCTFFFAMLMPCICFVRLGCANQKMHLVNEPLTVPKSTLFHAYLRVANEALRLAE